MTASAMYLISLPRRIVSAAELICRRVSASARPSVPVHAAPWGVGLVRGAAAGRATPLARADRVVDVLKVGRAAPLHPGRRLLPRDGFSPGGIFLGGIRAPQAGQAGGSAPESPGAHFVQLACAAGIAWRLGHAASALDLSSLGRCRGRDAPPGPKNLHVWELGVSKILYAKDTSRLILRIA